MKIVLIKFAIFLLAAPLAAADYLSRIGGHAQGANPYWNYPPPIRGDNPVRRIGATNYNLQPLFDWQALPYDKQRQVTPPCPGWQTFEAKVARLLEDGLIVRRVGWNYRNGESVDTDDFFFVRNFPGWQTRAEEQTIVFTVLRTGTYQYRDRYDRTRTLVAYDYGLLPTREEILEATAKYNDAQRAAAEARRVQNAERLKAAEPKILALDQEQAAAGIPFYQYRLGLRYLEGNGVTQNLARARSLLQSAADQGHAEASDKLKLLP